MARQSKRIPGEEAVHYEPPRKARRGPKPKMQPPLTPMIDVTFQLLLFFILTCEFRVEEGRIPGTLPPIEGLRSSEVITPKEIKISLQRTGFTEDGGRLEVTYFINRTDGSSTPQQLFLKLQQRQRDLGGLTEAQEVPIVIEPNDDVPWEFVVEAFSQAVRAKFKKIGFAAMSVSG